MFFFLFFFCLHDLTKHRSISMPLEFCDVRNLGQSLAGFLVMHKVFRTGIHVCTEPFPQFSFDHIYCFLFSIVSKICILHHPPQALFFCSPRLNSSINCKGIKKISSGQIHDFVGPTGPAVPEELSLYQKLPPESNFLLKKQGSHRSSETSAISTHLSS